MTLARILAKNTFLDSAGLVDSFKYVIWLTAQHLANLYIQKVMSVSSIISNTSNLYKNSDYVSKRTSNKAFSMIYLIKNYS